MRQIALRDLSTAPGSRTLAFIGAEIEPVQRADPSADLRPTFSRIRTSSAIRLGHSSSANECDLQKPE